MARYTDADALYEKTAEWEAQALHMVELHINDEDKTEWKRWSVILTERSAFKFDIADSPTADVTEVKRGEWIVLYDEDSPQDGIWKCSRCDYIRFVDDITPMNFCPNCGADMRERREEIDGL